MDERLFKYTLCSYLCVDKRRCDEQLPNSWQEEVLKVSDESIKPKTKTQTEKGRVCARLTQPARSPTGRVSAPLAPDTVHSRAKQSVLGTKPFDRMPWKCGRKLVNGP